MKASVALLTLVNGLPKASQDDFKRRFLQWKETYHETLGRRSVSKVNGKSHYTHRRLRSAMKSINTFLPYLFTYQQEGMECMPNTNNKIPSRAHYASNRGAKVQLIFDMCKYARNFEPAKWPIEPNETQILCLKRLNCPSDQYFSDFRPCSSLHFDLYAEK